MGQQQSNQLGINDETDEQTREILTNFTNIVALTQLEQLLTQTLNPARTQGPPPKLIKYQDCAKQLVHVRKESVKVVQHPSKPNLAGLSFQFDILAPSLLTLCFNSTKCFAQVPTTTPPTTTSSSGSLPMKFDHQSQITIGPIKIDTPGERIPYMMSLHEYIPLETILKKPKQFPFIIHLQTQDSSPVLSSLPNPNDLNITLAVCEEITCLEINTEIGNANTDSLFAQEQASARQLTPTLSASSRSSSTGSEYDNLQNADEELDEDVELASMNETGLLNFIQQASSTDPNTAQSDQPSQPFLTQHILCQSHKYTLKPLYGFSLEPESSNCLICYASPAVLTISPCYHCCLCEDCAIHLIRSADTSAQSFGRRCPVCRTEISQLLKFDVVKSESGQEQDEQAVIAPQDQIG
ncbi:hypothetical protein BLNAU_654 [Blattamonas nauphoetae]|uniref:RING-type domain-containing protein n=1 Tax=Blattamonas nauphoetae TaxID=2049346 RepID=A0ABQ9YK47_9EUKA|nr:hypothetical protein BLNAU_654 [Blattamonas nauphoetae]